MKKLALLFALLFTIGARGGTVTNVIDNGLLSLNGTNTTTFVGATATLTLGKFYFQNGGSLGSTQAFKANIYVSLDGTTRFKLGTYYPAATTATNEPYSQPSTNLTFYVILEAVTTNTYSVKAAYQAP